MLLWSFITRGRSSTFLFGFLKCGSVLLVIYIIVSFVVPHIIERYARVPADALARWPVALANRQFPELLEEAIKNTSLLLVLGLPLVILALVGGWLNEKLFRVVLSREPRAVLGAAATESQPPPA